MPTSVTRYRSSLLTFGLAFATGACSSAPRVEAGSPERCSQSLQRVGDAAAKTADSAAVRAAIVGLVTPLALRSFGAAMAGAFSSLDRSSRPTVSAPVVDSGLIWSALCQGLEGASASEIVQHKDSLARRVTAAFDQRYSRAYVSILEAAKASFTSARDSLAAFKVESARLEQTDGFIGIETTIILTVSNGTAHTIKRAYFGALAQTPGREVPWIEDTFNYSIAGGLAPGERVTWRLQPNMFSGDWSKVRVPREARFFVEALKLEGPDEQPLWGGVEFTRADQKLLDSLIKVINK